MRSKRDTRIFAKDRIIDAANYFFPEQFLQGLLNPCEPGKFHESFLNPTATCIHLSQVWKKQNKRFYWRMCKDVLHDKARSLNHPQGVHTTWEVLCGFAARVKSPRIVLVSGASGCTVSSCFTIPCPFRFLSFFFLPRSPGFLLCLPCPFLVCILFLLLFRFCFPFLSVFFHPSLHLCSLLHKSN